MVEKEDAKEEARSEKSAKKSKSPKRAAAADSEEKWDWEAAAETMETGEQEN